MTLLGWVAKVVFAIVLIFVLVKSISFVSTKLANIILYIVIVGLGLLLLLALILL